ncbi:hypothetical protein SASPL_123706 [Salvia splendens]|uniref:Flavonoid 3'-monooxygenase n=1 Tax=Salvia splendens TaxID=180675 RepID=A0A8X8XKW1_SALSN|nr:hypothetical protein SASPL_123706 [Salvia splendens]
MTLLSNYWLTWLAPDGLTFNIVIISIFIIIILTILIIKKSSNQNLPPGPRGLPLVGNLLSLDPDLHTYFAALARAHGPIYKLRLGTKLGVVVTSPDLAREVLKVHDATFANRDVPVAGKEASYGGADIVWTPYGPEWRMLRKVCVREMLSGATLDSVYALRRRELRQTIAHLYVAAKNAAAVDVGEQMFLTVLNVITSMLWGGTVEGEERAGLGAEFKQVVGEMTELLGAPNFSDFFPVVERLDLQGIQRRMRGLAKRFDGIFESMIDRRLKMSGGSKDFLQILLQMKDASGDGDATPFTISHVKALLMVTILINPIFKRNLRTPSFATTRVAMAERMFMYSLASLLHSFDWSVPDGHKLDLEEKFGIVLKKKHPLVAMATPRLSHPSLYE